MARIANPRQRGTQSGTIWRICCLYQKQNDHKWIIIIITFAKHLL